MNNDDNDRNLGVYSAAVGNERDATKSDQWKDGFDQAEENRHLGLDPFGKPPNVPRLCARDVRLVCNCADSTRRHCVHPKYPDPMDGSVLADLKRAYNRVVEEVKRRRRL